MDLFSKMLNTQLQLFTLMLVGIIAKKTKLINLEHQKGLSDLIINVILPANIINSFLGGISVSKELLTNCVVSVLICLVIQVVSIKLSPIVFKRYDETKSHVMQYGMIVSNSSFIGIPVAESLYGSLAVMYTSVFQIPIRVSMWSAGLALFTKAEDKKSVVKKVLTHPCIIAVELGLLIMLLQIKLPLFLANSISALSKSTTATSMIVIGAILADIEISSFFDSSTLYFSFIRLIGYPLIVLAVLKLLPIDPMIRNISVIMTAMPCGSTAALLAQKYGYDAFTGAKMIFVSTLLSIITIPLVCLAL